MEQITTVGIDLAKNVSPLYGQGCGRQDRCCSVRCGAIGSRRWWPRCRPAWIAWRRASMTGAGAFRGMGTR